MTRKHYQMVADVLSAEYAISDEKGKLTVRNIAMSLADKSSQDNASFNRERFYVAVGFR